MIAVSDTWKNNQYKNFTPKGKVKIKMTIPINGSKYDYALNHFTFTDTGFEKGDEITSDIFDYSGFLNPTIESDITNSLSINSYTLDSSINLDKAGGVKNPSAIVLGKSNAYGELDDDGSSSVMVSFDDSIFINKIKIVFSDSEANEYPNEFDYFVNDTIGFEKYSFVNSNYLNQRTIDFDFDGVYLKNFGINLTKWCSPYKFAKIDKIIFYTYIEIGEESVKNVKLNLETSNANAYLPKNQLAFDLLTYNSDFSQIKYEDVFNSFLYKSEVVFSFGYKVNGSYVYKVLSTTYINEWSYDKSNLSYSIITQNKLYFMSEMFEGKTPNVDTFINPLSENNEEIILENIIVNNFNYLNLFITIVESVENYVYLDNYIDLYNKCKNDEEVNLSVTNKSKSELLLEIAQATNLVLYCNTEGKICINSLSSKVNDDYITQTDFVYSADPQLEEEEKINQVKVNYYNYNSEFNSVLVDEIYDNRDSNTTYQDSFYFTFDRGKKIKYSIIGVPYQGSVNQTANSLCLFLEDFGNVEVKVESTGLENVGSITSYGKGNTTSLQEVENELIYSSNIASSVSKYLKDLFQKNKYYTITLRIDPRLETTDVIPIVFEGDTKNIRVEKIEIDFNNLTSSTIEGVIV